MKHIQPDLMQRFLADEVDLMERETVTEHLTLCEECTALLIQMTADDDSISLALGLDEAETDWVASVDLTAAVMEKLRPWYRDPAVWVIVAPLVLLASYMLSWVGSLLTRSAVGPEGPVGFAVGALRELVPALWKLGAYLGQGGLLRSIWPVLLLAGAIWFWRSRTKKEVQSHA
ncbi:MAG TPA: hypothetical protein VD973_02670 [Symbiobacteriaceae bacterium]|jgi:anti-sigma factor RsiW|nr:hypothetical protein [Symbiobacteriaceae bacterium]